jgi:deazaflavin-dependent oxidoreductase (nitroreductase family)
MNPTDPPLADWEKDVTDSPSRWVAEHVRSYVASDGMSGHQWSGVNTLLLTTRGRRTGKLRRTALIYGRDGDGYVVVGSKGGSHKHPMWYLNLRDHPEVHLQVGADKFVAKARTALGEERSRLWGLMAVIWPEYEQYQKRTSREIPVVVLEPQ